MTNETGNARTVWLVHEDPRRDYSATERFGDLKVVFSAIGRNYVPSAAISAARATLNKMREDDYIAMSGDPALCAVCVAVAVEKFGHCTVLRWDRNTLSYTTMRLDFD